MMRRIRLQNILSFGLDGVELEMEPLTVLIGPNGSGKSNLIDVMGLLKALPTDLGAEVRKRGDSGEWVWKGEPYLVRVDVVLDGPADCPTRTTGEQDLFYSVETLGSPYGMDVQIEALGLEGNREKIFGSRTADKIYLHDSAGQQEAGVGIEEYGVEPGESMLSAIKDRRRYPEVTHVGESLKNIHLYRNWVFGRQCPIRLPQKNDLRSNVLQEDGGNLGLVLNRLAMDYEVKQRLISRLRDLYDGLRDLHIDVGYGNVQVYLQEDNATVPATRLSDGTLRYLYLLALLCDPSPPALVCLEEPELGLHPDILPGMARLLREASERCQLIVTTHSDVIVDALTETPESIVVCEKHEGQTTLRRLRRDDLEHWLDRYRLGELWSSGDIGGNRW